MTILESEIQRISAAVEQATGFGLEEIRSKDKSLSVVRARIIMCNELRVRDMTIIEIGKAIGRHHSTVTYFLSKYSSYFTTSRLFREMAIKVKDILQ